MATSTQSDDDGFDVSPDDDVLVRYQSRYHPDADKTELRATVDDTEDGYVWLDDEQGRTLEVTPHGTVSVHTDADGTYRDMKLGTGVEFADPPEDDDTTVYSKEDIDASEWPEEYADDKSIYKVNPTKAGVDDVGEFLALTEEFEAVAEEFERSTRFAMFDLRSGPHYENGPRANVERLEAARKNYYRLRYLGDKIFPNVGVNEAHKADDGGDEE